MLLQASWKIARDLISPGFRSATSVLRYMGQAVEHSPFKETVDKAVMQWMTG